MLSPARLSPGTLILPPPPALPDRGRFLFADVASEVNARIEQSVWPPVGPGEGLLSSLTEAIKGMDVVNGMDQTLGKTHSIPVSEKKQRWGGGKYGQMTTKQALGRYSGRWPMRSYSRLFDTVA